MPMIDIRYCDIRITRKRIVPGDHLIGPHNLLPPHPCVQVAFMEIGFRCWIEKLVEDVDRGCRIYEAMIDKRINSVCIFSLSLHY